MLLKTKAIVLRAIKYSENKYIIDLLTEAEGRVSVVINIPKTSKGKLKKQYFQLMSLLEVDLDFRQNETLHHLRDVRMAYPYSSIPQDPYKLSISLFLAEFLYYSTRDERQNPNLFAYIENSMRWLDGSRENFSNFHLVFMMRFSRFIGFFPNVDDYHPGDFFDMRNASFISSAPLHTDFLNADESSRIQLLMRMNYDTMHLFKMNHTERDRIIDVLITYYRLHVPNFPELQSLKVMKELWE
ncbi:MAG: DNA repair protein RecO [Prevotella sp.]|nr:DNA repair protein RecO [Prevotella sp.]